MSQQCNIRSRYFSRMGLAHGNYVPDVNALLGGTRGMSDSTTLGPSDRLIRQLSDRDLSSLNVSTTELPLIGDGIGDNAGRVGVETNNTDTRVGVAGSDVLGASSSASAPFASSSSSSSSAVHTAVYVMNASLGVGTLALCHAFHMAGLALGAVLLLFHCVLNDYSNRMLSVSLLANRKDSFESLVVHLLGRRHVLFLEFNILAFCFGSAVAYLMTIKDVVAITGTALGPRIPESIAAYWPFTTVNEHLLLLSLFGLYPLCLFDRLADFKSLMYMGVLCFFYVGLAISGLVLFAPSYSPSGSSGANADPDDSPVDPNIVPSPGQSISSMMKPLDPWSVLGVFVFAFANQPNIAPILYEMPQISVSKFRSCLETSSAVLFLLYLAIGALGYVRWSTNTTPSLIGNLIGEGDAASLSAVIMLGSAACITFPLNIYPIKYILNALIERNFSAIDPRGYAMKVVELGSTMLVVLASFHVATSLPTLSAIIDLFGTLTGSVVCFLYPAACYVLSCHYVRFNSGPESESGAIVPGCSFKEFTRLCLRRKNRGALVTLLIGVAYFISGTRAVLQPIFGDAPLAPSQNDAVTTLLHD